MKPIYSILIFIVILVGLTGCEQVAKSRNPLVGNWVARSPFVQATLTFQSDNTLYLSAGYLGKSVYSYEISDGKISLTDLDSKEKSSLDFEILGDYKAIKLDGITYYPSEQDNI